MYLYKMPCTYMSTAMTSATITMEMTMIHVQTVAPPTTVKEPVFSRLSTVYSTFLFSKSKVFIFYIQNQDVSFYL